MLQALVSTICYIPLHFYITISIQSVPNTRCVTQCSCATCNTKTHRRHLPLASLCNSCQSCQQPWSARAVSWTAPDAVTAVSVTACCLGQSDAQEPTISVCHLPHARASGFALIAIAKAPCQISAYNASVSERAARSVVLVQF
jgi:hypothetical protein